MMRGPEAQSIAVRNQEGEIVLTTEKLKFIKDRYPVLGLPLIRGVVNFGGSMVAGVKALMYSASFYPEEDDLEPGKFELWMEKHIGSEKLESLIIYLAVAMGLGFSVLLFFLLPTFLVGLVKPIHDVYILRNLCEGIVKIVIFTAYMVLVSRMKDMKRVFSYHGAEHKTIKCYEMGLPLTVENVRPCTRKHPRCGTSFLFVVIFLSILVGSVIQVGNTLLRMLCHLALLIPVVAISYEINRLVGRHDNWFTKILTAPGLWFQNFTTNEPDDSMIECAIAALEAVIPEKEGADNW
ncbi:MAG: DUF1385 domain-containing protein [Oscillospiraceae bacterium]|nr:DUF1385 domain-containing protein [Oscillospiraceae bacterium]